MAQGVDMMTDKKKVTYIELLTGEKYKLEIPMNAIDSQTYVGSAEIDINNYQIVIQEEWKEENDAIHVKRTINGVCKKKCPGKLQGITRARGI